MHGLRAVRRGVGAAVRLLPITQTWGPPDTDAGGMLAVSLIGLGTMSAGAALAILVRLVVRWRRPVHPGAGWYRNPRGVAAQRWWNHRWTDQTRDTHSPPTP